MEITVYSPAQGQPLPPVEWNFPEVKKWLQDVSIQELYNSICVSFPRCSVLSDARRKAIRARFSSGYTLEQFEELFRKAEASHFLRGQNPRNWRADFDWLINDANMAKVLSGNYDDHDRQAPQRGGQAETNNLFAQMLNERRNGGT